MTDPADIDLSDVSPRVFEAVVVAIGGIITAVGVVSFIVAYGLLKGMGWAWTLTVVLPIISILLNAISLQENLGGIVCVIISGIILYYIYRSPVKSYFGRGSSPALSATTQALRICYRDLLRRVNDIGKSLALQKMNKACKQLNPLSLDLGLYLSDCRIPDEAYSLQFYFLSIDSFKRFALVQDFYRSIHSLGSPSIAFRAVEKHNPQDSNRYLQFFTWIFQ